MTDHPDVDERWIESFFTDTYLGADLELRDPAAARAMVDCAATALRLPAGARLLDLACGTGRHSVLLAERGYRVTGVDLAQHYLDRARARAGELPVEFVRADMRQLAGAVAGTFDAVLSLHTSFGFFPTEAENLAVLTGIGQVLAPGGTLLLDVMNRDWFLSQTGEPFGVAPHEFVLRNFDTTDGITYLHEERFDPLTSRITWRIRAAADHPGGGVAADYRVYSAHELLGLLGQAGFEVTQLYGDYDCSPFGVHTPHLIVTARRPA